MAQVALADNYVRRLSITSSLATGAAAHSGAGPAGDHWAGVGADGGAYPDTVVGRVNRRFARSWFGRFFDIEHRRTTLTDELRAGFVGFLTVSLGGGGGGCRRNAPTSQGASRGGCGAGGSLSLSSGVWR